MRLEYPSGPTTLKRWLISPFALSLWKGGPSKARQARHEWTPALPI